MTKILQKEYVRNALFDWYFKMARSLPWRETRNPYHIWLSEVILQQTRVEQGLPYYLRFTENFPEIKALALAPEDLVMRTWQGLGYYSRARNLHKTAKVVWEQYGGVFPNSYEDLLALPGIGPYTAAAIASLAYKLPHAVVDGNVYRVLSRLLDIDTPIDSTQGKKVFQEMAQELLNPDAPDIHNQAMMELGATVCKPQQPMCLFCPVQDACQARSSGRFNQLPVKSKKVQVKDRYLHYFLVENGTELLLGKRGAGDIWEGLYEFVLIEHPHPLDPEAALAAFDEKLKLKSPYHWEPPMVEFKHILTHQRLWARIFRLQVDGKISAGTFYSPVKIASLRQYALPRLLDRYLEKHFKLT